MSPSTPLRIEMEEKFYYLGFSVFPGVGPKRFQAILDTFGAAKQAWSAGESDLKSILGNALAAQFLEFRKTFSLEGYKGRLEQKNVWFVTLGEDDYPKLLAESLNPPFVLYGKGDKHILRADNLAIGIVGTRKITSYGRDVTQMITEELVAGGCVIVSGLALGVDAIAHQTTIDNNGKTIAVLGSGVDVCHPTSNLSLYDSIVSGGGAVVSEYPLGEPPSIGSFPSRNRIIAGLSNGIVVTEGAEDSGALITAKDAFANNRAVFAVPGPITSSLSKGPNSLLAKGANLVTSGNDILDELGIEQRAKDNERKNVRGDTAEEQKIIDLLQNEELHFDEILKRSGLDSAKIGIVLSLMEMKGMIKTTTAGMYSL